MKYNWELSNIDFSQCQYCLFHKPYMVCDAFPEGIPKDIQSNKVLHNKPYEGDNDIQFKITPGLESDYKDLLKKYNGY